MRGLLAPGLVLALCAGGTTAFGGMCSPHQGAAHALFPRSVGTVGRPAALYVGAPALRMVRGRGQQKDDPYAGLSEEDAALKRMEDLDEMLQGRGINDAINSMGWTLLTYHSRQGDLNSVRLLLLAGVDVNKRDEEGSTALHYAAGQGHETLASELIAAGADPAAPSLDGRTPLHRAAGNGKLECTTLLAELDSNLDRVGGPESMTPLEEVRLCKPMLRPN
jgi:hypothetical protein